MASAEFLEQALSTDVDENAVNAIVGSLENQLIPSVSSVSSQRSLVNHQKQTASTTSSASSVIGGQKYISNQIRSCGTVKILNSAASSTSASFNNVQGTAASIPLTLTGTVPSEPLKVIYTHNQTLSNHNNRVTFPAQPLANGCIGVPSSQRQNVYAPAGSVLPQPVAVSKAGAMQTPLVIKQGAPAGQVGIQQGMVTVPMSVNSNMPTSIPNVMTLSKPGGQNVVVTTQNLGSAQPTIIPNVQILNMRPGAPNVAAQKSVATVSPRVVIGTPQVVGTRAAAPGITLQTLQSLQQGQQGHLLLKTENGQYQLLRVGPAPGASTLTAPQAQTIRLSTVPAHPGVATVSTSAAMGAMPTALPAGAPAPAPLVHAAPAPAPPTAPAPAPATHQQQQQPPQAPTTHIKPSDNTKEKCRNFLANLLDLSSKEPPSVEMNVRNLIQELIDALVEPEEFCDRLERLLNASPQPCLIGFLKKSLPLLRQSLVTKELVIEGINPPMPHVAFSTMPAPVQPIVATTNVQMHGEEEGPSPSATLTPLLPPVLLPEYRIPVPVPVPATVTKCITHMQPPPSQQKAGGKSGGTIAVLQNIPVHTKLNVSKVNTGKAMTVNSKSAFARAGGGGGGGGGGSSAAALSTVLTAGKSLLRDKEKKAASQFAVPFGDDKMAGDDDINDVAAMGGVNLAEETQRILGSTELIGTQIRSCKEEFLVGSAALAARVRAVSARLGLEEPGPAAERDIAALLSHALHERLKTVIEKLAVVAQHRIDFVKSDSRYETTQDVKSQLKFLEELDRVDKKRREDSERELLLRAAKSRSKNEDPEQAKLKAKAKEMQRAELEELRQREANLTALQAIGPRKKQRLDGPAHEAGGGGAGGAGAGVAAPAAHSHQQPAPGFTGRSQLALRTRLKRINHRDMVFLLEQERDTAHSPMLYRTYLK